MVNRVEIFLGIILVTALLIAYWPSKEDVTQVTIKYDCRVLIGGWHPDFPAKVIEECKKRNQK